MRRRRGGVRGRGRVTSLHRFSFVMAGRSDNQDREPPLARPGPIPRPRLAIGGEWRTPDSTRARIIRLESLSCVLARVMFALSGQI